METDGAQGVGPATGRSVVLHIGAGKCGSSSIQASLSRQPALTGPGGRCYEYTAWSPGGVRLRGAALSGAAASSVFGYLTAPAVADAGGAERLEGLLAHLGAARDTAVPILSNEGWAPRGRLFAESGLIARAGLRAHVVLIIRPPVDWLNSAWWQWGAWTGHALEHWIERSLWQVHWASMIERWRAVPGVEQVSVLPMGEDVLHQFGRLIGAPLAPAGRMNIGSDHALLRLMQRHPELRPGPHDPHVNFVMARWAPPRRAQTPWVIPPTLAERVLSRLVAEHRRLIGLVDAEAAAAIGRDARWWDPQAYADRGVEPAGPVPPVREESEALALRAFLGLRRARPDGSEPIRTTGQDALGRRRAALAAQFARGVGGVSPEAEEADLCAVRAILDLMAAIRS